MGCDMWRPTWTNESCEQWLFCDFAMGTFKKQKTNLAIWMLGFVEEANTKLASVC